jgi:hypothetical protein
MLPGYGRAEASSIPMDRSPVFAPNGPESNAPERAPWASSETSGYFATQQPLTHRGWPRPPGHAPLIGLPHGGARYSARLAAAFVSGSRMQFPSDEMMVHSSSERHARSECGTLAHWVSRASHRALPFPWGHWTRSIRSPGFRPQATGASEARGSLDGAAMADGAAGGSAEGAALGGPGGGTSFDSSDEGREATGGDSTGGGALGS